MADDVTLLVEIAYDWGHDWARPCFVTLILDCSRHLPVHELSRFGHR